MTIKEAMKERHMVRRYTDREIPSDIAEKINERLDRSNEKYGLNMSLVTDNDEAFNAVIKLILAKGVRNYIVLAGPDDNAADEKLGYCGADIMLFAQTLGLNTWWVGGTFSRKGAGKNIALTDGLRISGVIAIGYGASQGVPHKSKSVKEIGSYEGDMPDWFKNGLEAVLLAPTALNKQAFNVSGSGNKVSMTCSNGIFSGVDLGIGKYHFETGAGKENFEWR